MARMLGRATDAYVGCCNACSKARSSRHKPGAALRHIGRAREKRQWRREL